MIFYLLGPSATGPYSHITQQQNDNSPNLLLLNRVCGLNFFIWRKCFQNNELGVVNYFPEMPPESI